VLLSGAADGGAVGDVLAQQVTAGDVHHAEVPGDAIGLGALAGPRGPDQQQSHRGSVARRQLAMKLNPTSRATMTTIAPSTTSVTTIGVRLPLTGPTLARSP